MTYPHCLVIIIKDIQKPGPQLEVFDGLTHWPLGHHHGSCVWWQLGHGRMFGTQRMLRLTKNGHQTHPKKMTQAFETRWKSRQNPNNTQTNSQNPDTKLAPLPPVIPCLPFQRPSGSVPLAPWAARSRRGSAAASRCSSAPRSARRRRSGRPPSWGPPRSRRCAKTPGGWCRCLRCSAGNCREDHPEGHGNDLGTTEKHGNKRQYQTDLGEGWCLMCLDFDCDGKLGWSKGGWWSILPIWETQQHFSYEYGYSVHVCYFQVYVGAKEWSEENKLRGWEPSSNFQKRYCSLQNRSHLPTAARAFQVWPCSAQLTHTLNNGQNGNV